MDPAFCANTLQVLADDHILARNRTEPELVKRMIAKKQEDIIFEILTHLARSKGLRPGNQQNPENPPAHVHAQGQEVVDGREKKR